jgi:hypothetical protein
MGDIYIFNNCSNTPSTIPGTQKQNSAFAWIYVMNDGSGTPRIARASDDNISVKQVQPGEYVVTFDTKVKDLACIATLNNSVGFITAVPGDNSGLQASEVRVITLNPDNSLGGAFDFSLAVFFRT